MSIDKAIFSRNVGLGSLPEAKFMQMLTPPIQNVCFPCCPSIKLIPVSCKNFAILLFLVNLVLYSDMNTFTKPKIIIVYMWGSDIVLIFWVQYNSTKDVKIILK
jgi:hypothetical protein